MPQKILSESSLKSKIQACWLGKAIGGTLGGPHEGKSGPLELTFYDPVPASILPNDDLDLQVVWLCHLLNKGCHHVTPDLLSDAWRHHVAFPWDEYGICHRNDAYGLKGYRLGAVDNFFGECMGAAIRSELWACLAAGNPQRAAAFAWADAACDHTGDGIWAEVFFSALEAAAFVESRHDTLLDLALDFLPGHSRIKDAVQLARISWSRRKNWMMAREEILAAHENGNFTDVAANLAFTILGWLAGEGDFGKSILIAANCGMDTDCTSATLGALLGIIDPTGIPKPWSDPIGKAIVLNPQISGLSHPPNNLEELTRQTLQLSKQLSDFNPQIQEIVPRCPQSNADKFLQVPVKIGFTDRSALFNDAVPISLEERTEAILPGHWIRREAKDFRAPVMVLHYTVCLEQEESIQLMAWSQTSTKVWINGIAIKTASADPVCAQRPQQGAPSFHRGGRGHFMPDFPLKAGRHELVVAWEWPSMIADLVVGVGNAQSKQWLPFALASKTSNPALCGGC